MADRRRPGRLAGLVRGPALALPRPLDAVSERWARVPPRMRGLLLLLLLCAGAAWSQGRIQAAETRWGGAPVTVLRATTDLAVGATVEGLERVRLPPAAVPPRAALDAPDGAVLALALPEGAVLTDSHLDARGPAAGLPRSLRAVPVPVEPGWRVTPGGWVDVWVLGAGSEPSRLVARSRAVLQVRQDGSAVAALLALAVDEVGPATEGLALGRVLLAHAPPPAAEPEEEASPPRPAVSGGPGAPGRPRSRAAAGSTGRRPGRRRRAGRTSSTRRPASGGSWRRAHAGRSARTR